MPDIVFSSWRSTIGIALFITINTIYVASQQRFGLPSSTLHAADSNLDLDQLHDSRGMSGGKIYRIDRDVDLQDVYSRTRLIQHASASSKLNYEKQRIKRDAGHPSAAKGPKSLIAHLGHDSHTTLIVHWAGEGSDVILALAKNSSELDDSALYVSYDYGKTFADVNTKMTVDGSGHQAVINKYFTVNKFSSHYLFTDLKAKCLFTTDDSCKTFSRHCRLPFTPRTLSLHPHNPRYILGLDEESDLKQLYLSDDFGSSWTPVLSHVKAFYWDFPGSVDSSRIYAHEDQAGGKGQILRISLAAFATRAGKDIGAPPDMEVLLTDVVDFQIKSDYIFATKSVRLLGSPEPGPTLQLWISHKGERFQRAEFPHQHNQTDFFVADASEGQLMVCVSHNASYSNLYISDVNSYKFSLSLERVVYFNPKISGNKNWIRAYTNKTFADVTKMSGVRGIYIASQQVGGALLLDRQVSLISYDKGGVWQRLAPPELTINGRPSNCATTKGCNLHLMQMFHQLFPGSRYSPILTLDSAPGLVVASGVLGSSLKGEPDVFVSASAGVKWTVALAGPYMYATADQGGIIAAIHQQIPSDELLYSTNEGETWQSYKFADTEMRVYGLMTEPGENTTVFTVFGSPLSHHSWTIIQVDMKDVFQGKKCASSDYKMWSVNEDLPAADGCLLGRVTQYQRRDAHALCYNGEDFVRETVESNCMCTREDFECDYGYEETSSNLCQRDSNVPERSVHQVPQNCAPGTFYNYTRGYRKVPGDTCHGGREHSYSPLQYSCPVQKRSQFLLITSEASIGMLDLGSGTSTRLLDVALPEQAAAVFDWENNSVIFVDTDGFVKSNSLEASQPLRKVLLQKNVAYPKVTSLAFDWTGRNVFVVKTNRTSSGTSSSAMSVIDVVNVDHRFHRQLYSFPDVRSFFIDPHDGFMYFVGKDVPHSHEQHYHIYRVSMDGTDPSPTLVFCEAHTVGADTVLTFDRESSQLYWIDSNSHYFYSAHVGEANSSQGLGGGGKSSPAPLNLTSVIRSTLSSTLAHASAIATFRDYLYVSFSTRAEVVMTRKSETFDFTAFAWYTSEVIGMVEVSNTSHHAMSACSPYHSPCSQLCLPRPSHGDGGHNRTCRCGEGYRVAKLSSSTADETCMCEVGEVMKDGLCFKPANASSCGIGDFTCSNGHCVSQSYQCDGDDDCHDGSDEVDCAYKPCKENTFTCYSGKCIPSHWRCDREDDCRDGLSSDELNCENYECVEGQFQCKNKYCISHQWLCDGDNDCHDGSDEENCNDSRNRTECSHWEFTCIDHTCVDLFSKCNGLWDCPDGSDETKCEQFNCTDDFHFSCRDENSTCILHEWVCDYEQDCPNGRDEENCPTYGPGTTPSTPDHCLYSFTCDNKFCVGWETLCNGVDDCGDQSDEIGCYDPVSPETTTTSRPIIDCAAGHFFCRSPAGQDQCLPHSSRCNSIVDCKDGTDEEECEFMCRPDQFSCEDNRTCVWRAMVCDGNNNCPNGKDEEECDYHSTCGPQDWTCVKDGGCVPHSDRCNGKLDCDDASDEVGCDGVDCSVFNSHLEGCCQEDKCGVYLHHSRHWWEFFLRDKSGTCKPIGEAAANVDHNMCGTRAPAEGQYHCGKQQFSCHTDRRCLAYTQICNRVDDCGNNHDEMACDCDSGRMASPATADVSSSSVTWIVDPTVFSNFSYSPLVEGLKLANLSWKQHPAVNERRVTVSGLKPSQMYGFVFNFKNQRCQTELLSVQLEDGLSSAPQHVEVTSREEPSLKGSRVDLLEVKWEAPLSPRGTIMFYNIYYQQINNDGTAASDVYMQEKVVFEGSSHEFQDTVVEHIEQGRTYHLWVAAVTKAGVGASSVKQSVNVSPGPDRSLGPKVKMLSDSSLMLQWVAKPEVKGYKVTVRVQDRVVPIADIETALDKSASHLKIRSLCPGTWVNIRLAARYKDGAAYELHAKDDLMIKMNGKPPKVNITSVELQGPTSVLLSYKVTEGSVKDKFLIYYTHDLSEPAKNVSAVDTRHLIRGLFACERYFVWVRPSFKTCPAVQLRPFLTQEDLRAPPRDVEARAVRQGDVYHVKLTWRASCGHHVLNTAFILNVQAGQQPDTEFRQSFTSREGQMLQTFKEVTPGVTYKFTVRSDVAGSRPSEPVEVTIPSLDGPTNLIMQSESSGHKVMVRWEWLARKDVPEFKEYILHTSGPDGLTLTNHTADTQISLSLGQDGVYSFSVDVKDKQDRTIAESREPTLYEYESHLSVPSHSDDGSMSRTNLVAILVPVAIVVVALSAGLVFFIVRHKRLQRSFLAFANSHYNIQSGTTTFSDDLDGDEPLIQGFSDDEPLVIA